MLDRYDTPSKLISVLIFVFPTFVGGTGLQVAIESRMPEFATALASPGADGWYFPTEEFHYLAAGPFWGEHAGDASKAPTPDLADPLPAILNFHEQLKSKNVALLLVPIPPKLLVYPDKLEAGLSGIDAPPSSTFYQRLREEGIPVVELLPIFQEERTRQEKPLYCKTDSHYSGYGCVVTARAIAEAVRNIPGTTAPNPTPYAMKWKVANIPGDLAPTGTPAEPIDLRFIGTDHDGSLLPVGTDRTSEVLLLGDSHCLVFSVGGDMHTEGAGLADQLAYELGHPIDLLGVRGSGSTPARLNLFRRARRDPAYWDSKSIVIWCFAAREFTESPTGWRPLPIASDE